MQIIRVMKIPFSPPDITKQEAQAVCEVLESGWITTGPKTKELERQIAAYCGTRNAVCLSSATACMESILRLFGVGPGDEVITSAYTYTATASVVCHVGARLVLVDVASETLELDETKLAAAITERTKVIIPVDIGGLISDYSRIYDIVEDKRHLFRPANELQKLYGRILVMADSAHAFGSEQNGLHAGAIADFTAFSFHAVKNLTTAEGGALTWKRLKGLDDEKVYRHFQLLSLHGQSKDALSKTKMGAWEYDIEGPWYKCNMTDITAAIGLVQLQRYPTILERRRELIRTYNQAFIGLNIVVANHFRRDMPSNGHLYMVRLLGKTLESRNDVINQMAERGISCNVHFKPLPMMTAYRSMGFDIKDFPNAYKMYENEISLPLYSRMTDEEQAYVISNFKEIVQNS